MAAARPGKYETRRRKKREEGIDEQERSAQGGLRRTDGVQCRVVLSTLTMVFE